MTKFCIIGNWSYTADNFSNICNRDGVWCLREQSRLGSDKPEQGDSDSCTATESHNKNKKMIKN